MGRQRYSRQLHRAASLSKAILWSDASRCKSGIIVSVERPIDLCNCASTVASTAGVGSHQHSATGVRHSADYGITGVQLTAGGGGSAGRARRCPLATGIEHAWPPAADAGAPHVTKRWPVAIVQLPGQLRSNQAFRGLVGRPSRVRF